jgi:hypothetical protein
LTRQKAENHVSIRRWKQRRVFFIARSLKAAMSFGHGAVSSSAVIRRMKSSPYSLEAPDRAAENCAS